MFKNYPDVVTVEQMSEMLGISTKTAYKLLKENKIKHFMIGRIYKIPKYYILTYLEILDQNNSNKKFLSQVLPILCQHGIISMPIREVDCYPVKEV